MGPKTQHQNATGRRLGRIADRGKRAPSPDASVVKTHSRPSQSPSQVVSNRFSCVTIDDPLPN